MQRGGGRAHEFWLCPPSAAARPESAAWATRPGPAQAKGQRVCAVSCLHGVSLVYGMSLIMRSNTCDAR